MRALGDWLNRLRSGEDLDLYLLIGAAVPITVLGVIGVASQAAVLACVLALLALLSVSQLRSRHQVARLADSVSGEPLARLLDDFPPELEPSRNAASDVLVIGTALSRTVQSYRRYLPMALDRGARVRVLLLDPHVADVYVDEAEPASDRLSKRILHTLDELRPLLGAKRSLEVRLIIHPPSSTFNVLDPRTPDGMVVVQRHEFRPAGESTPILALRPSDGYWYQHFVDEAERMWNAGQPWPAPKGTQRHRSNHGFVAEFPADLWDAVAASNDVLVTGVARNNLFNTHFLRFEQAL